MKTPTEIRTRLRFLRQHLRLKFQRTRDNCSQIRGVLWKSMLLRAAVEAGIASFGFESSLAATEWAERFKISVSVGEVDSCLVFRMIDPEFDDGIGFTVTPNEFGGSVQNDCRYVAYCALVHIARHVPHDPGEEYYPVGPFFIATRQNTDDRRKWEQAALYWKG